MMKIAIFLFSIFTTMAFLLLKIFCGEIYFNVIQEDSIIEYLQSFIYLISSAVSCSIAFNFLKMKNNLLGAMYIFLSLGFIFICGEEMSWGQRIFGIDIPEYFRIHNIQKEITIHNLDIAHYVFYGIYVLIGFWGSLAWIILPKKTSNNPKTKYFVPGWHLTFYFLPALIVFLCYCIYGFLITCFGRAFFCIGNGSFIVWRDQEPAELLLSLGFLLFVITNKLKQSKILLG